MISEPSANGSSNTRSGPSFLDHEDPGLVIVAHLGRNILDEGLIITLVTTWSKVMSFEIRPELPVSELDTTVIELPSVTLFQIRAADIEGVGAQATDDLDNHFFRGRLDEEGVVALGCIEGESSRLRHR